MGMPSVSQVYNVMNQTSTMINNQNINMINNPGLMNNLGAGGGGGVHHPNDNIMINDCNKMNTNNNNNSSVNGNCTIMDDMNNVINGANVINSRSGK